MRKGILLSLSVATLLLAGCANRCDTQMAVPVAGKTPQVNTASKIIHVEANGIGVAPCSGTCSSAQAVAMARRAAILDGYKALAEKIYGIKINGRDSVKNMMLKSSTVRAYVEGLIKNAKVVDEEYKNGIYRVAMQIDFKVCQNNFCDLDNF
jgi:hypothetical protein